MPVLLLLVRPAAGNPVLRDAFQIGFGFGLDGVDVREERIVRPEDLSPGLPR